MNGRTKMIVILTALGVVAVALFLAFRWGSAHPSAALIDKVVRETEIRIEQDRKAEMDRLQTEIDRLNGELRVSTERYRKLKGMIAKKSQEAAQIQTPKDDNETKSRFTALGYPPVR